MTSCPTCRLTAKAVNYAADHFEFPEAQWQRRHIREDGRARRNETNGNGGAEQRAVEAKPPPCVFWVFFSPDVSAKQGAPSRKLGGDDLAEINTISTGSLMGQKTHLIAGCHNAFGHIGPRRDIHVMSAAAPRRQSAVRDSDRPSRLTVSDSYLGRALPHQSSPQGQSEVTGVPPT